MGAWIEILISIESGVPMNTLSHPTMGAWIEILDYILCIIEHSGRTPRWVRGLKFKQRIKAIRYHRRTPRWVRGLKFEKSRRQTYCCRRRTPRWVRGLKLHC